MGEFTKYRVVLTGSVMPNENREKVIQDLSELFHSKPSYMEKLLSGQEVPLKREYPAGEAQTVCKAVRAAGAECKVVAIEEQKLEVIDDPDSLVEGLSVAEFIISCPSCLKDMDRALSSCPHCGYEITHAGGGDSEFSYSVHDYGQAELPTYDDEPLEMAHMASMKRFVGPNAEYYEKKFPLFNSVKHPRFRLSWHWPALFGVVFFFWALYRKQWILAAVNYVGTGLLVYYTTPSPLWLAWILFWPVTANYFYFLHVARHIRKMDDDMSKEEKEAYLDAKGGTSKLAMAAGIVFIFAISIAFNSILLSIYENRFGDGSTANQQLRGDGTILVNTGAKNSKLSKTSSALIVLSNALKVVIASGNETVINTTIDRLIQSAENEEIRDAWGNNISIERDKHRVVLLSPGPDGKSKTDDDILQMVLF